jgi:N6-adenosine-specific RNA methylase IME4
VSADVIQIGGELEVADFAPASAWAARIAECWRASVEAILEVGELLAAAKEKLPHGEFSGMIESELPFGARTAQMLMKIAADPRLANPKHVSLLPPSWGTLYELTKLDDESFDRAVEQNIIRPDMERREIAQTAKRDHRVARERTLGEKQTSLPTQKFGVILADPEWRFEPWSRTTGMDRAADNHYPTSCTEVIASRDVASIAANDCVLFLWATAPILPQAFVVMAAWGFDYRSNFVWGKDRVGMGYWNRNKHEHLLIGVKGNVPAPTPGTQSDSLLPGSVGEHSAKPEIFFEMIERYFPTLPKIELNCRGAARPGWVAWGNEAECAGDAA